MRASPFVVGIGALRKAPGTRRAERREGVIPGLRVSGSEVPEGGEVVVDVVLELVPAGAIVRGTVEAPWAGECRRCLGEARGRARTEVWEVFEEQHDPEQTYPLHGDQLDLEPMARDAVLLELPLAPLCKVGCRGLCPTCGADRNVGDCDCEQSVGDPRWAALDALREN
ncbi:MAG: DUF177 domain-containing protein [Actinomycetota bacterium]|nr:DUF177 domain-containing protein [Actinomycetota bacterium]